MRKTFAVLVMLLVAALPAVCLAQTAVTSEDYTVTAEIPEATGITPTLTKIQYVENGDDDWLAEDVGTSINFEELVLNTFVDAEGNTQSIYLPDHYYAIDLGVNGVYPQYGMISVSYTDNSNPNASNTGRDGLATHGSLTYKKVAISTDSEGNQVESETNIGDGVYLMGALPGGVSFETLRGGWLRLYAGIVNLDPDAVDPAPSAAQAFTPADMPGVYSGTITVTFSPS